MCPTFEFDDPFYCKIEFPIISNCRIECSFTFSCRIEWMKLNNLNDLAPESNGLKICCEILHLCQKKNNCVREICFLSADFYASSNPRFSLVHCQQLLLLFIKWQFRVCCVWILHLRSCAYVRNTQCRYFAIFLPTFTTNRKYLCYILISTVHRLSNWAEAWEWWYHSA